MSQTSIDELRDLIARGTPSNTNDAKQVQSRLVDCWREFDGNGATNMAADKLWRIENLTWTSQNVAFEIERHGATVNGSSRAHVQLWAIDIDTLRATIIKEKRRQLYATDKRLDVRPLAACVAEAILSGQPTETVRFLPDGRVKVDIAKVIPQTVKQTTLSRRARFRNCLRENLQKHGWVETSPNRYERRR